MSAANALTRGTRRNFSRTVVLTATVLCAVAFVAAQRSVWLSLNPTKSTGFLSSFPPRWRADQRLLTEIVDEGPSARNMGSDSTHEAIEGTKWTKEKLWKLAPDGILMVTMANQHFLGFVITWVYHLHEIGLSSYLVGTLDDKLEYDLKELNINCFNLGSGLPSHDFIWGTEVFMKMGAVKAREILMFLDMGFNVIFTDVDAIWLKNPIPYWRQYWRADVLMSTDLLVETHVDGGLEDPTRVDGANIGILMMKPSAKGLMEKWVESMVTQEGMWDQQLFLDLLNPDRSSANNDPDRLFKDVNGTLSMGFLPVTQFCSGHSYFMEQADRKWRVSTYAVHTTFQSGGGTPGKRQRLREALLWVDPPEYFDRPNGFLAYEPDIPEDLLANAPPKFPDRIWLNDTLGHFALVNHQLTQIRNALSIAHALNRTLVMPKLWCGHERHQDPHPGRVWGNQMTLPYECPMDHVFNVGAMVVPADANRPSQPFVEVKEHSFLYNKRLPDSVKRSAIRVEVCEKDDPECPNGFSGGHLNGRKFGKTFGIDGNPDTKVVHIKPNLTDVQLKAAFANMTDIKILYFSTMLNSFGGFESQETAEKFRLGTIDYADFWCCVERTDDIYGNVFYDLYHDIIPHTDKFGRLFNTTWEPINF